MTALRFVGTGQNCTRCTHFAHTKVDTDLPRSSSMTTLLNLSTCLLCSSSMMSGRRMRTAHSDSLYKTVHLNSWSTVPVHSSGMTPLLNSSTFLWCNLSTMSLQDLRNILGQTARSHTICTMMHLEGSSIGPGHTKSIVASSTRSTSRWGIVCTMMTTLLPPPAILPTGSSQNSLLTARMGKRCTKMHPKCSRTCPLHSACTMTPPRPSTFRLHSLGTIPQKSWRTFRSRIFHTA